MPLPSSSSGPRRKNWGWYALAFAGVLVVALAFAPVPYVIQQPGPVFDTLGAVEIGDTEVAMIEVDGGTSYPTEGSLSMLTASIVGSRETRLSWLEVAFAWFNPSQAVQPLDAYYPEGVSFDESQRASRVLMENSKSDAVAAAMLELGYEVPSVLVVDSVIEGYPADGVVKPGDRILSLDGTSFDDVASLRDALAANGTGAAMTLLVDRDGETLDLELTPQMSDEDPPAPIFGVVISNDYEFPFDVTIQLDNVGGSSAGMMFALGIIDTLTPGAMTGGESIAGTGTITRDGNVGEIGGIRQKLYGARDAGAHWFLAPASNCGDVVGHVPDGLTVFRVSTLTEAVEAVEAIADGDTASLATCSAV